MTRRRVLCVIACVLGASRAGRVGDIYNEEKNAAAGRAQRNLAFAYERGGGDVAQNDAEVRISAAS